MNCDAVHLPPSARPARVRRQAESSFHGLCHKKNGKTGGAPSPVSPFITCFPSAGVSEKNSGADVFLPVIIHLR